MTATIKEMLQGKEMLQDLRPQQRVMAVDPEALPIPCKKTVMQGFEKYSNSKGL